jgi:hypothetical protein
MRQYLLYYEPAIHASIKAAQQQPLRSLFTFPGFSQQTKPLHVPQLSRLTKSTPQQQEALSPAIRGNPLNSKHMRWRAQVFPFSSIQNVFQSKPD